MTPLPSATEMPVVIFVLKKSSSTAAGIRIKNTDELAEIRIYPVQPAGQRRVRRRSYHAAAHKALFAPLRIYHAKTNRGHAGVYAQNSQTYAPLSNTFYHGAALKSSRAARRRARPSSQLSGSHTEAAFSAPACKCT